MKKLIYAMILAVFFGTQILAINLGFKLSLYRLLFLTVSFIFVILAINNDERIRFFPRKISSHYLLFYGWWVITSLLSVIWVENIGGWFKANVFIGIGALSILYIQIFIRDKESLLTVFKAIAVGTGLQIAIGMTELATGRYRWASNHFMTKYQPASKSFLSRIPISIYPNENDYATMLLMGSFFIFILFKVAKKSYEKIFYLILWFAAVFLIYQTDSRANVLALVLGLGAMSIMYLMPLISRKLVIFTGSAFAIIASILIAISPTIYSKISEIVLLISTDQEFGGSSNEIRINLIRNGFLFLKDTLGFGVGAGNIEYWMNHKQLYQTGGMTNMHSWWMEILTAYGIVTFSLYLFVYCGMILKAYNYYKTSYNYFLRQTSLAIVGFLIAFTMSSISSATNIINEWQWLVFGVIIAFFSYGERMEERNRLTISTQNYRHSLLGGNHG